MSLSKTELYIILHNHGSGIPSFCHMLLARSKSQVPPTLKENELNKSVKTRNWGSLWSLFLILDLSFVWGPLCG